jgi:NADH dehydrogenase/NADH:ubiquinone oxidoreductase subunit G
MDVEAILKEIRNRVVSDAHPNEASTAMEASANGSALQSNQLESLARASAHLAVTGRSWDRLPPIFSNRQGLPARIELWIKTKGKSLTRWFTWEQVNFNRAVNDALCDVVEILKAEAHELASMRAQLTQEMRREFLTLRSAGDEHARGLEDIQIRADQTEAALTRLQQTGAEQYLNAQSLKAAHAALTAQYAALQANHASLESEHSKLANQVIELAGQLREEDRQIKSEQSSEIDRRLTALAADLKEEQRVCFRQVSLESSEAAVLEDRARRALMQRLEQIEAQLKHSPRK